MAFGIAFLILSWNKRLEGAVQSRTVQLKKTNESLIESNSLLASANKQLEIHDNMQKEFINVAAHELRTPIMPILGEAELLENAVVIHDTTTFTFKGQEKTLSMGIVNHGLTDSLLKQNENNNKKITGYRIIRLFRSG